MDKLKFGTDGWRAIIAKDFTVENVARVSVAVAQWLKRILITPVLLLATIAALVASFLPKP
ncbi:MAG: hypothetical protein M0D57_19590 [Sphingobacteriales bacterium JAD_PAG50586_3]|nr:MAG: hypothetical protein M0D57_19590 [Sphingobacteriales bacterium JAD_PAG50586_3]